MLEVLKEVADSELKHSERLSNTVELQTQVIM